MENIVKTEKINTGGNCIVDVLHLENGKVIVISGDYCGLYQSIDDFLKFEDNFINGFWL